MFILFSLSSLNIQTLEGSDFTDIRPLFPPMMHTICLVYSHSQYFNSAARIIVLITNKQIPIDIK